MTFIRIKKQTAKLRGAFRVIVEDACAPHQLFIKEGSWATRGPWEGGGGSASLGTHKKVERKVKNGHKFVKLTVLFKMQYS